MKTCQNCSKELIKRNSDKNKFIKYCSFECRWKNRRQITVYKKKYTKTVHDIDWKTYWSLYHQKLAPLQTIKNLMRDDILINNKAYDTYNLFTPNNITL